MGLTALAIVAPGDIITSAQQNIVRGNFEVLDARTGGDPSAAGRIPISSGALASAWTALASLTHAITTSQLVTALGFQAGASGVNGGGGGFATTGAYRGGTIAVGSGILSVEGLQAGAMGVAVGAGGVNSAGPLVVGTTGTVVGNLNVGGVVTIGGALGPLRVLASVADALTPPYTAHANQAGVECTNVRAASATVATSAVNAAQLSGVTATANAAAGANKIPIADASGKLDAWISPSGLAGVPTGLGAWWSGVAASIPSGWARCDGAGGRPNMNGRVPVGAGTTFGQTFTEGASYGVAWSHDHATPSHSHSGAPLSVSGVTGQPSATGGTASGTPPPSFGTGTHTHDQGTLDVSGNTATDGAGTSGDTAWLIPMYCVIWIVKT